jgi:hypothetical protein
MISAGNGMPGWELQERFLKLLGTSVVNIGGNRDRFHSHGPKHRFDRDNKCLQLHKYKDVNQEKRQGG